MNEPGDETLARALVSQSSGLGPRTTQDLIEELEGDVLSLFESPERAHTLEVEGLGEKRIETLVENLQNWKLDEARERLDQKSVGILSTADEAYPDSLAEIYDPPAVLFYRGGLETFDATHLAVVGTRKGSEFGKNFTQKLTRSLAEIGITIVSGLAAGIDAAAHRGALNGAENSTVAVLGTGVDVVYPKRNRELQEATEQSGLLVSEYPPGTQPDGRHFPRRNRIISGLTSAVLVVQAPVRSGAIITADAALEQGREVYAVPGSVDNELHKGCHRLIKEGAGLVESPEDVIDYLQVDGDFSSTEQTVVIEPVAMEIFEEIHSRPMHLDELAEKTGYDHGTCSKHLLELENKGLVLGLPGQRYQRSSDARQLTVQTSDEVS